VTGFEAGLAVGSARLRGRWGYLVLALAAAIVASAAWLERRDDASIATDVVLGGVVFGWTIPLTAYAAVARACRNGRLDDAVSGLARQGASRRGAVSGLIMSTAGAVGALGSLLAVLGVLVSRGFGSGGFGDAVASAWIGALGGAAYVAWFALASLVGRRGGGRSAAFVIDAVLGGAATFGAIPWPRAHLRSLVGGALVPGLSEWQSAVVLAVLALSYWGLCIVRVSP
jgi:hypothetical protein